MDMSWPLVDVKHQRRHGNILFTYNISDVAVR